MQRGYSLLEFVIASGLSVGLLMLVTQLSASHISNLFNLKTRLQLQHSAYALADLMHDELARVGFIEQQGLTLQQRVLLSDRLPEPVISQHHQELPHSCVTYSYDKNRNGFIDTGSSSDSKDERFGFRIRNHALERRVGGKTCEQNGWHDISEPNHRLLLLEFVNKDTNNQLKFTLHMALNNGTHTQQIERLVIMHNVSNH